MNKLQTAIKNVWFLSVMIFCFVSTAHSQEASELDGLTVGTKVSIHSEILDESRKLMIYLPEDYDQSIETYPVLYLLDGEWHFHHVSGILQFFQWAKTPIKMILVAIPNTHRGRDFSPSVWPGYSSYTGGASEFNGFLEKELIPTINKKFRTSKRNILCGHSLAGTFTLFSFLTKPEVFDTYISLSPCLFWYDRFMLKTGEIFFKKYEQKELNKILYIAHEYSHGSPQATMWKFIDAMKNKAPKNLRWTSLFQDGEDHFSYVHKAIINGLEFAFKQKGR